MPKRRRWQRIVHGVFACCVRTPWNQSSRLHYTNKTRSAQPERTEKPHRGPGAAAAWARSPKSARQAPPEERIRGFRRIPAEPSPYALLHPPPAAARTVHNRRVLREFAENLPVVHCAGMSGGRWPPLAFDASHVAAQPSRPLWPKRVANEHPPTSRNVH